jgi:hypothetical protein
MDAFLLLLSFFLSVSLSAPTFGLSIRARDTNSTFFSSDVVMNLLKTQKIGRKQTKRGSPRDDSFLLLPKEKFQTFFYSHFYAELFGWLEFITK